MIKAESTRLRVTLCLNKSDLVSPTTLEQWQNRLITWGYDPIFLSVQQRRTYLRDPQPWVDQLIDQPIPLLEQLQDRVTVVSGPSGVGKSSLINWLIPQTDLRVGAVSGKLGRGRHTTRHVELFHLPTGGLLADSPGFNQASLTCEPQELIHYFPEARHLLENGTCQFSDCLHRDEPNCAVRGDWERYEHYLNFLEKTIAYQEITQQQPDVETSVKAKDIAGGAQHYEPKLELKKYRRSSRRSQHQALQTVYEGMTQEEIIASEDAAENA